ncbi:MAG: PQQ-binding-like beta-propeller repeat protein, partial [Planctomycetota bacterium]|nr:PQQ-binding-like beta-propeller repeat protein [Planctomycetota bacterium]
MQSAAESKLAKPRKSFWQLWQTWSYPIAMVGLVGAVIWSYLYTEQDRGVSNLVRMSCIIAAVIITVTWPISRSQYRPLVRFGPTVLTVIVVAVFFGLFRIKNYGSDMTPIIVSRWREEPKLPELAGSKSTGAANPEAFVPVESATAATDYPNFMGPDHNQVISSVRLNPDWDSHPPQLVWKKPIGYGWSGFAIVGSNAVTSEQRDDKETIACYDLNTGDSRWSHTNPVRFDAFPSEVGPRSTPTIAHGRVFSQGATGILDCLSLATGELLWSKDILKDNDAENLTWGKANSPLAMDDLIVVSAGGTDGKSLVAYRQDNGEKVWSGGSDFS